MAIERKTRPGARGLASHGWTQAQAERFAQDCRDAGFAAAEVRVHGGGRRRALAVTAAEPQ